MHHQRNVSYRELEEMCRKQARLSVTPRTRQILEIMAFEYQVLADWQESDELEAGTRTSAV
jgi:hypothetical protein